MNTFDFVIGQLLSFEMMKFARRRPPKYFAHTLKSFNKEHIMENQLLIILFLVVSLVANMTVMADPEK